MRIQLHSLSCPLGLGTTLDADKHCKIYEVRDDARHDKADTAEFSVVWLGSKGRGSLRCAKAFLAVSPLCKVNFDELWNFLCLSFSCGLISLIKLIKVGFEKHLLNIVS